MNEEDFKLNEKRQSTDSNTEMTKTLQLLDKDFKVAMVKIRHQAITNMSGTNAITEIQSSQQQSRTDRGKTTGQRSNRNYQVWTRWKIDWRKMNRASYLWSYNKRSNIHVIGLLETEEKGEELKSIWWR